MKKGMKKAAWAFLALFGAAFTLIVWAAILALLPSKAHAAEVSAPPSSFASLQPFKSFPKGAGEGVAYEYKSRTKAQFVALFRNKRLAKKEMRVTCDVLVRQMMEGHKTLPFEGCEGAAAAIEHDNNFAVVSCRDEMFQRDNFLAVTSKDGSAFGAWHRKCLPNEQVLTYKAQPLISLTCLNVAIPVMASTPSRALASPPQAKCYIIPVDYRNTPGVVWDDQHRAHISAHLDATEKELEEVSNDPCLAVVDARGSRKPFHRCEFCVEGEYPPAVLAKAVGLLPKEPKGVLSFHLQDGMGYISLPPSWAARWMLYCVDIIAYPVSVRGYEGWQAVSRFDVVEKNEIERTLPKGTLDRTLSGARHY